MNNQTITGTILTMSGPIANAAASAVGVAKTGASIGSLHGAAYSSAMAAWVGFGSMKVGVFMMGAAPVIGAILILDSICGRDPGSPMIDWYEEFWRQYELQDEVEKLKIDSHLWIESESDLESHDQTFRTMEIDYELESLKNQLGLH
jgi:hypothetical protein